MAVLPLFGNLAVETGPHVVTLRLNTNTGTAVFSYREIEMLAKTLAGIRPPAKIEEDDDDVMGLI